MGLGDRVFGLSQPLLAARARRMELIAGNLAHQNTPGYQARDLDFAQVVAAVRAGESPVAGQLHRTHARHLGGLGGGALAAEPLYRQPLQPALDGNTVEPQREYAEFMDNAVRYQASLNFLDARINSARRAIRGE